MPPAWLAWIAGSLPEGTGAGARAEPALGTTVIVAGATLWMTESRDGTGSVIDRPDQPYRIPIDAFSVRPASYAPFVPPAMRDRLIAALRRGEAVLGDSSAALRHIGAGGTLRFGSVEVVVGQVVPDEVVGFAEMFVARKIGRTLGIVADRYLLSLPVDSMTGERFAAIMAGVIAEAPVRTVEPGGSPYMRIASGVNPPVVTKTIFGEFAAAPEVGNEAYLDIDPAWTVANIRTRAVPLLGSVTCHEDLFAPLVAALREVRAQGLGPKIHTYSGCWAARTVQRSRTAPPSQHAYGAAIDINAPESPFGAEPNFDTRIVAIFEDHGFLWGGAFLIPDGHHFEWGRRGPP